MPSAGFSHFYADFKNYANTKKDWCQCPLRASLISTYCGEHMVTEEDIVSMPSAGFSHFYQKAQSLDENERIVSMPSAGFSHFYVCRSADHDGTWACVNALCGLLSFLPFELHMTCIKTRCVNALCGLLSFLLKIYRLDELYIYSVSMPSAGFSHFYGVTKKMGKPETKRCQCPLRASLISTVPSETPHKLWLPRLNFASICRNILISMLLRGILGLFIIYS